MKKPIPVVFTILSLVYLVFILNSGETAMIGDDLNGDPGSKLLPIFVSIIMFVCSVFLLLKKEPETQIVEKEKGVFYLTIILSILYVLFFRFIGFLLITNILLFTLVYFYSFKANFKNIRNFVISLILSTLILVILYTVSRVITRSLIINGLRLELLWMRSTGVIFVTSLVIVTALSFFIKKMSFMKIKDCKKMK